MIANGNNSPRIYMSLHSDTHYPDSEAASLCSFSLTLRALHYKSLFMCLLPKDCESAKSWPCVVQCILYCYVIYCHLCRQQGRIQGGVGHRSTQKFEKIWFFGVRSWFFHTKYPKMVCASLRSAQFFKVRPPPNLKSWIRPWTIYVYSLRNRPEMLTKDSHRYCNR